MKEKKEKKDKAGGKPVKAYKGFNADMTCRGFQYEVGKEYENGRAELCEAGFHACESPLAVWEYYPPVDGNRFCGVELSGEHKTDGSKTVSTKIKIGEEIGIPGLVEAHVEYCKEQTKDAPGKTNDNGGIGANIGSSGDGANIGSSGDGAKIGSCGRWAKIGSCGRRANIGSCGDWAQIGSCGDWAQIGSCGRWAKIGSSGDWAQIGSCGDWAQIGSSGDGAKIGSSGYGARIDSSGENAVVAAIGHDSAVRAALGAWVCLTEYAYDRNEECIVCVGMKAIRIDGRKYKPGVWYKLKNGKVVAA